MAGDDGIPVQWNCQALPSPVVADLQRLDLHFRDDTRSTNPPVLHLKELFVSEN